MLRQCLDRDETRRRQGRQAPSIRKLLPELVDAHGLDRAIAPTKRLALPELELLQRDHTLLDLQGDDRDLVVALDILDLIGALRHTVQIYRDLTHRP